MVLSKNNNLPVSSLSAGIGNPNAFSNNINPVMVIPSNSEVALKDIAFSRTSRFKIGTNVSLSLFVGEFLDGLWADTPTQSLSEITSMPFPIPLEAGEYNERTFATMLTNALAEWISYPDMMGRSFCEPAAQQGDGTNNVGYIFNFMKGVTGDQPGNFADGMVTAIRHYDTTFDFTYTHANQTYTNDSPTAQDFADNKCILTDAPLSLNNGEVTWDVTGCTSGFRLGLVRPSLDDGRAEPPTFNAWGGDASLGQFYDIVVEYDQRVDGAFDDAVKTLRIYHAVYEDGLHTMKEVEYYNNAAADFTPTLNAAPPAKAAMYRTTPTTFTDIGGEPTHISILVSGEDTMIKYVFGGTDYILTDSRLCIKGNAAVAARVPTRNRFVKPIGLNTWALYPTMSLNTNAESVVLDTFTAVEAGTSYKYPEPAVTLGGANEPAANPRATASAGSSFYGRAITGGGMNQAQISRLNDRADPYNSTLATAQKQYVGISGPTGLAPPASHPVRIGEGNPRIPDPATSTTTTVNYAVAIVLIPPAESESRWAEKGVYACSTSDVSEILGFSGLSLIGQTRQGNTYNVGNAIRPDALIPTKTEGATYGWYVGSTSSPVYASGPLFVRCPTLTHQSYNFGKGIPSKIIGTFPADSIARDVSSGYSFYAPSELTYLDLHNTAPLQFNDIRLEIVDKNDEVVEILDKSTTIVLHFRQKSARM